MTRYLLASLVAGLAALSSFADGPPMAMPGGTPAPKAVAPWPTTPTVPPQMMTMSMDESGEYCEAGGCCRCGLLCRLSALWSGRRYAYLEPSQCPSVQCSTPVYCSYECSRARLGERGRRFGLGRFTEREGGIGCRERFARLKAFICWRPAPGNLHCMVEPYQTPVRYYFKADAGEYGGNAGCANGNSTGDAYAAGGRSGRLAARRNGVASGEAIAGTATGDAAIGGTATEGGEVYASRERGLRGEVCNGNGVTRIHRYSLGIEGGVHGGRSHTGEQVNDLPGSTFQGNIRFAKDEKQAVPTIDASHPGDLPADWQKAYSKKPPEQPPAVQQAGLAVPQR